MNASTIQAITNLVNDSQATHLVDPPKYIERDGAVTSLENLQEYRYSTRATFKTNRVKALEVYVKDRLSVAQDIKDINVFVNPDKMSAQLYFDNFKDGEQGHCRDKAECNLKKTAAFEGVLAAHGKRFNQKDLVSWLIDWNGNVTGAKALITTVRNIKVITQKEATSNITATTANRSLMENVEARSTGELALPESILFNCETYLGFGNRQFAIALQAITGDDKIEFALRIESLEAALEAISDQFAAIIQDSLGVTPHIGSFDPQ